jgi:uncharacterized protein (DUF169 family)
MDPEAATTPWSALGRRLVDALRLTSAPVGIAIVSASVPDHPARFDEPLSPPASDGRRGRVAASCVFWVHGASRSFTTVPEDHGNCSVGLVTHGLATLEEVADRHDVGELLTSGWVSEPAMASVPRLTRRPDALVYGPLDQLTDPPDVVLLRVHGRQLMVLHDAVAEVRIDGKPQCHIVAVAHEQQVVAASVGCALSRARTGMRPEEMTCAVPGPRLGEVVAAVEQVAAVDGAVAAYAARDSRRARGVPAAPSP